jgi:hypothetical protein
MLDTYSRFYMPKSPNRVQTPSSKRGPRMNNEIVKQKLALQKHSSKDISQVNANISIESKGYKTY